MRCIKVLNFRDRYITTLVNCSSAVNSQLITGLSRRFFFVHRIFDRIRVHSIKLGRQICDNLVVAVP